MCFDGRQGETLEDQNLYGESAVLGLEADMGYVVGTLSLVTGTAIEVMVKPDEAGEGPVFAFTSLGRMEESETRYMIGFSSFIEAEDTFRAQFALIDTPVMGMSINMEMFKIYVKFRMEEAAGEAVGLMERVVQEKIYEHFGETDLVMSKGLLSTPYNFKGDDPENIELLFPVGE